MNTDKPTIIDLMRHGKPEGGDTFRGKTDVALSELGFEQMHSAMEKLKVPKRLVSSPMKRCWVFAEMIADEHGLKLDPIEQLAELSFGDWDGRLIDDIKREFPEEFNSFWRDPVKNTPPNGELMQVFQRRVLDAFWKQVERYKGEHLLMVLHGGVIRVILSDILSGDSTSLVRFDVPYAAVSQIRIYHHGDQNFPQLVFHNA